MVESKPVREDNGSKKECNLDFWCNDYYNVDYSTNDVNDCIRQCRVDLECEWYTWSYDNECFLSKVPFKNLVLFKIMSKISLNVI